MSRTVRLMAVLLVLLAAACGGGGGGGTAPVPTPTACILVDKNVVFEGDIITFTPAPVCDPDGQITGYLWDFSYVGGAIDDSGADPDVFFYGLPDGVTSSYSVAGTYQVALQVKNAYGKTDLTVVQVYVTASPNVAQAFPAAIDFGTPQVGEQVEQNVFVFNSSAGAIEITGVSVTDPTVSLPGLPSLPITVAPNSTQAITVRFISYTTAAMADLLTITTNAEDPVVSLSAAPQPGFARVGNMNVPRKFHTATLIDLSGDPLDGQVLITGGQDQFGNALSSVELYDPATRTFTLLSATPLDNVVAHDGSIMPPGPRRLHAANWVADSGVVMITGGDDRTNAYDTGQIFDPVSETWSYDFLLSTPRTKHTATVVTTGGGQRVVLVGGTVDPQDLNGVDSVEVYTAAGGLLDAFVTGVPRVNHAAVFLGSGEMLVAGGLDGTTTLELVDLIDVNAVPATLTALADLQVPRYDLTVSTVDDGMGGMGVLMLGGGQTATPVLDQVELYDPAGAGSATIVPDRLMDGRRRHVSVDLGGGRGLLVIGGLDVGQSALATTERIAADGNRLAVSGGTVMHTARGGGHRATLLLDGSVLVTGGLTPAAAATAAAEIYVPAP